MKALCFDGARVCLEDRPRPEPGPGEALVRVRMAGVCATDLEIVRGYAGHRGVLGHEMLGQVEACGSDPEVVGRRVAAEINVTCGECERCLRGHPTHCARRQVMGIVGRDGCFAEYVVLPRANLHLVPDTVADEAAVFAEPLAAAFEILRQVEIGPGDRVAVLGDGRLGLLVAMALRHQGCALTVLGRHRHKLDRVAELGIPTEVVGPGAERDMDVVVECTGSPEGLELALDLVRPRGSVVLKSTFARTPNVDTNRIVVDEIRVLGSRCGPFDVALAALADGRVDPRPLVDARYPLIEGPAALEHAARRGTLKVLVVP